MVVLLLAGHILFRTYGFDNEGLVDDIGLVERLLDHDLIVSMELLWLGEYVFEVDGVVEKGALGQFDFHQ